ncbi:MAG: imidazole glycerol phosphate synthase subunit HisF [Nitrososphaeraceae archaeon]|jgi:cyclase|nr:imidazole glycerol phosphate synthase subunit HisF [Nitrososphaeraceae archaeon]MDW0178101.1 imidazole glycerol phosphate synthase subunit HisF [Nitrososphaeraceae archaeon]MDW0188509.1 imidazole glycerol phosphate synthase subunit HisF [Nitrososphaeraceae archaeon]MDW0192010.1 imidazole glycerol phosphate synthase subunit HisF [Nitrososphaeraceae archaeon]MDW0193459.1 imidazole glycerol phosphate synthase subunit HisF [Nitrososphaeraceae archaeon]
MPLSKRIIPCLDVDNGRVVKGIKFRGVKDAGDPVELAKKYSDQGADELVFLDITASKQDREIMKSMVKKVASVIDIPFTVGGGIKTLADAREILLNGADKVSINTASVKNPELVTELMKIFGRQCIVAAIDVKRNYGTDDKHTATSGPDKDYYFEVMIYGGSKGTGIDAIQWAKKVEELGAGEILLTSIDADGTKNGYDIELTNTICNNVRIPVIASGGCGSSEHMVEVFNKTDVDAVLAASIFHYDKLTLEKVKKNLAQKGIQTRL